MELKWAMQPFAAIDVSDTTRVMRPVQESDPLWNRTCIFFYDVLDGQEYGISIWFDGRVTEPDDVSREQAELAIQAAYDEDHR